MSPTPNHDDLAQLREVVAALAALKATYIAKRAELRLKRAAEIARLRGLGWTPQRIASAFHVARSAVNQWADPPADPEGGRDSGVH